MRYAMNHHHRSLRIEILKNFPTQSDFASAINEHESKVSQVLRGRRKLSPIDAEKWKQILNCPQAIIESVTDYKQAGCNPRATPEIIKISKGGDKIN
jgi:hypothetical protein